MDVFDLVTLFDLIMDNIMNASFNQFFFLSFILIGTLIIMVSCGSDGTEQNESPKPPDLWVASSAKMKPEIQITVV